MIVEGLIAQWILIQEIATSHANTLFIDIDGTVPNILKERTGWLAILSSSGLADIAKQIISRGSQNEIIIFNSLNTLIAESILESQNKDWTYRLFRKVIGASALCSMASKRTVFVHLYWRLPDRQKLSQSSVLRIMGTMADIWFVRSYGSSIRMESISDNTRERSIE
ncbi:MAG: hypothetical protein QXR69_01685 [Conexivisphaerales archaeon]